MASRTVDKHKQAAQQIPTSIFVVTVSDSRTPETDKSGSFLSEEVQKGPGRLAGYQIVADDPTRIREILDSAVRHSDIVLFTGGTGLSQRDNTVNTLEECIEKIIPGFGEIFRFLSYQQIGSAAMLSRAMAGIYQKTAVFALPGSPAAVKLAWTELIEPEMEHLVWQLQGGSER